MSLKGEITAEFKKFQKEYITRANVDTILKNLKFKLSTKEFIFFIAKMDSEESGLFELSNLIYHIDCLKRDLNSEDIILKSVQRIDLNQLYDLYYNLGPSLTNEEVDELILDLEFQGPNVTMKEIYQKLFF